MPFGFQNLTNDFNNWANTNGVTYDPVNLDSGTQNQINKSVQNASQTPDQIAAKHNAGVNDAGSQALQSDQGLQSQSAGTAQNPAMLQAIRNQYNQEAGKSIGEITRNNQINAPMVKANWMQQAAQHAMAQQRVETMNYEFVTKAYNDAMMARAQAISSVMSLGETAGGMAMANSNQGSQQSSAPGGAYSGGSFEGAHGGRYASPDFGY